MTVSHANGKTHRNAVGFLFGLTTARGHATLEVNLTPTDKSALAQNKTLRGAALLPI